MTIEEIRRRKRELGYTNQQMAELSHLPLATVQKVLGGTTRSPRYQTIRALSAVFEESEDEPGGGYREAQKEFSEHTGAVHDSGPAYAAYAPETGAGPGRYPRQGSYTVEDYMALPDEQRVELIDGVFYDMAAPTTAHQLIGGEVHAQLREFLMQRKGSCIPFVAPVDVQLDRDERTMVQPDVCVVCDRSKITRRGIDGAPDFVVEVFSPSTKMKDFLIKLGKYLRAGVREYWMVDPDQKTVTKVLFEEPSGEYAEGDLKMETFPFEKPVPVGIFGDACSIDFGEIAERYAFLFT